jgi:hypothetical protein
MKDLREVPFTGHKVYALYWRKVISCRFFLCQYASSVDRVKKNAYFVYVLIDRYAFCSPVKRMTASTFNLYSLYLHGMSRSCLTFRALICRGRPFRGVT